MADGDRRILHTCAAKKDRFLVREKLRWQPTSIMMEHSKNFALENLSPRCSRKITEAIKAVSVAKRIYVREASSFRYENVVASESQAKQRELSIAHRMMESDWLPTTQCSQDDDIDMPPPLPRR